MIRLLPIALLLTACATDQSVLGKAKQAAYRDAYMSCLSEARMELHEEITAGLYHPGVAADVCHMWARQQVR